MRAAGGSRNHRSGKVSNMQATSRQVAPSHPRGTDNLRAHCPHCREQNKSCEGGTRGHDVLVELKGTVHSREVGGKSSNLYCTGVRDQDQKAHSRASPTTTTAREDGRRDERGHGKRWWWSGASLSARRPPGAIIRRQFPTALVPRVHVVPRPSLLSPSSAGSESG